MGQVDKAKLRAEISDLNSNRRKGREYWEAERDKLVGPETWVESKRIANRYLDAKYATTVYSLAAHLLGKTKNGEPRHPLMLPKSTGLKSYP